MIPAAVLNKTMRVFLFFEHVLVFVFECARLGFTEMAHHVIFGAGDLAGPPSNRRELFFSSVLDFVFLYSDSLTKDGSSCHNCRWWLRRANHRPHSPPHRRRLCCLRVGARIEATRHRHQHSVERRKFSFFFLFLSSVFVFCFLLF